MFRAGVLTLCGVLLTAVPARAQMTVIFTPRESQGASVSQVIGMSRVIVNYSRPSVKGRKVWGGVVPFGEVWRAGANENTVLEVSSPFTVGGTSLEAGRYGLHMIPTADAWTVIVSRQANAWGSFSYDPKEDAVRFSARPAPAEHQERLVYLLEPESDSTVTVTLRWEKLALSFGIGVPTGRVSLDSVRQQIRGAPWFFAESWIQAAQEALRRREFGLAVEWADSAIRRNGGFQAMQLKAAALERMGDTGGAEALRARSMAIATERDVNAAGYALLNDGKLDEAIALFRKNVADHPRSWNAYDSLAEALARRGDRRGALANYQKALDMVTDEGQKARIRAAMAALR